ncbi:MAG: rod shape-determining protein RodA [Oscillospiraceae bacterium]|nr:rod shape-determining protein RodA [Oscillospiraceae bacterium]
MKIKSVAKKSVMLMEFDWFLFIITILLSVFGIVMIYSATRSLQTNLNVFVQSGALILGCAMMLITCFFDYEQLKNLIKPIYIFSVAILILVLLIGIGTNEWGAKSWIRFGPIGIQPSEIAKVCFVITFSYHLSKVHDDINKPLVILGLLLHIGVLLGLIALQPDFGSAMVFVFIFICLMFTAKLSYKYIISVGVLAAASVPLIYKYVLEDYQRNRILAFFNPESDPRGSGFHVIQSKIAVGTGQVWGKGYLQGIQNQMGYLPEKHTDFIFSVISEELGFIGAVVVVGALFFLIYKCFKTAQKADNAFGRYICVGVGAMMLFHVFENVGMCIGLMPVTGIPLPFLSYGGTSLVVNMVAVGLVLSVSYHNKPRSVFDVY